MKKLFAFVICLLLLVCFTACNKSNQNTASGKETVTVVAKKETFLKEDIFDDIGLTYAELVQKYGAETERGGYDGGQYVTFENGNGLYFLDNIDWDAINVKNKCMQIIFKAEKAFNNIEDGITIADFSDEIGCEADTFFSEYYEKWVYCFKYDGAVLSIRTDQENLIDVNSILDINYFS